MKSQKESTEHLIAGLNKLKGAEDQVRALQVEAAQQQELLSKKQRDQDDQMNLITQKIERSLERRREVDEFKKLASNEESEAQVYLFIQLFFLNLVKKPRLKKNWQR